MNYSLAATLFLICVLLVLAGFLGRIGTAGIHDISANAASAIALLFVYALLLLFLNSYSELAVFFEGICGGIPYLSAISDYGSLENVVTKSPLTAAASFMDTIILNVIIEIILPFSDNANAAARKHIRDNFMVRIFSGVVAAIISLLILNYVIKPSGVYQWILSAIGGIIALISVGSIPLQIISIFKKNTAAGIAGVAGAL